jgi:pyruvate formate lyase activating enzyme
MRQLIVVSMCLALVLTASIIAEDNEARFYRKLADKAVQCLLCPRQCTLQKGQAGYCLVRKNDGGTLRSLVYAQVCALHVDPIEKKPLYHFLPGSQSLSLATVGCSMRCLFCQNWDISQAAPGDVAAQYLPPERVFAMAEKQGCASVSYTYSEPAVFFEYMYDAAWLAKQHGIRNAMVTSGHINVRPLDSLCGVLDAANVDLKGFCDDVYARMANTKIAPVLEAIKTFKRKGVWLELGYLVIPTVNDDTVQLKSMCAWAVKELGPDMPLHFLRFFPQHKLASLPPTPLATMEIAYGIATRAGIRYVYLGNIPGHKANHTYCHKCQRMIIERQGYFLKKIDIKDGKCAFCGTRIPGVWK